MAAPTPPSMPAAPLPARVDTREDIDAIDRASVRLTTPCGDGVMVWRLWSPRGQQSSMPPSLARPVVLLHGGSGSWSHWVRNIAVLVEAGHSVLAPDLPGCGDSDSLPPTDSHDADGVATWVAPGLESLLGGQRCQIVAFSFGAMVASLLAAAHPALVERLVIVGAPALKAQAMRPLKLRAWNHLPAGAERDGIIRNNLRVLMVAKEETMNDVALQMHIANLVRDRLHGRKMSQTDIVARTLPRLGCAVSGIWGARDALYVDRLEIIEPALAGAPGFERLVLIPGAGHWVQYEAADEFNATLLGMLS